MEDINDLVNRIVTQDEQNLRTAMIEAYIDQACADLTKEIGFTFLKPTVIGTVEDEALQQEIQKWRYQRGTALARQVTQVFKTLLRRELLNEKA